jgi:Putative cyclase
MMSSGRLIDVSHTVEHGAVTYQGLPAPVICDYLSREASRARYAAGTEFLIGKIEMVGNTGTYLDSPFHRYPDGKDLAALPLDRWRTSTASWRGRHPGASPPSIASRWQKRTCGDAPSWCRPAGTATGGRTGTSPAIPISPEGWPSGSSAPVPSWWGSTR